VREPASIDAYEQQQEIGDLIENSIEEATNHSDRSRQSRSNVLGVSDIGMCHEYVRRMIVGEEPSQEVHTYDMAAFVGTALGDKAEDALIAHDIYGNWTKQAEVIVKLEVRGFELNIPGHPDLYTRRHLIDFKSKDGLGVIRRSGPSDQERFQRALYAKALIEANEMDEECWLHNVYLDRSGREPKPVVWSAPFSWAEVEEAVEWIDSVLYAIQMGEEAMRDPSREWCWACCPFAPQCRGMDDSDVEGRVEDPFVLEAIKVYTEASEAIKALTKDKKSAESVLAGLDGGVTDSHKFRWIDVNPTDIAAFTRAGYRRLDIRPLRLPKRKAKTDES
jgi:hypothetical protein